MRTNNACSLARKCERSMCERIAVQHGIVLTLLKGRPAIPIEKGKIEVSETPESIFTKFGTGDYVGDMTQQAIIQTDRPGRGVPGNG